MGGGVITPQNWWPFGTVCEVETATASPRRPPPESRSSTSGRAGSGVETRRARHLSIRRPPAGGDQAAAATRTGCKSSIVKVEFGRIHASGAGLTPVFLQAPSADRSEDRRVGKEWVSPCTSVWSPRHTKKNK